MDVWLYEADWMVLGVEATRGGCKVVGAVELTGRQGWVEKLLVLAVRMAELLFRTSWSVEVHDR